MEKKTEYIFKNRWKQHTAYSIDFAPRLFVVKQLKCKSISFEWLGFCFTVQIKSK